MVHKNKEITKADIAKSKKSLFWYLLIILILFGGIFFLYYKYTTISKENLRINKENERHVVTLSELRKENYVRIDSMTRIISTLEGDYITLSKQLVDAINKPIDSAKISNSVKIAKELKAIKNSEYLIAVHSYDILDGQDKKIEEFLLNQGYSLEESLFQYSNKVKKPNWLSDYPAVFYYSDKSLLKAKDIAKDISDLTNKEFKVRKGAGRGVIEELKEVTFFVHNINQ